MLLKGDRLFLGSLKNESQIKNIKKNKLSLGKEVDEPKTSSLMKNVKQFHSEILKLKI